MPIRTATPADIPGILARWRELMALHAELSPRLFALAVHAPQTYAASLRRQMDDPDALLLVDAPPRPGPPDDVRGYVSAGLGLRAPIFEHRELGMVFDVAVAPALRGQGVGQALLAAAEAWFRTRGIELAQADFAPGNVSGARFWAASGYAPVLYEAYRLL